MVLANIQLSDGRKVLQFVKGIKQVNDRHFILEKKHKNLDEAYRVVLTLGAERSSVASAFIEPMNILSWGECGTSM
eukprot:2253854-Rhodomonas_salina.1